MTETKAIKHFKRTGCILPGHAGEIAAYIKENNHEDAK